MTYQPKNYHKQGGDELVIGGTLTIASGGLLIDEVGKWDDLRFPASAVRVPGSGGPASTATVGTIQSLAFDAGTRQSVHIHAQMPHAWKKGSDIQPHIHWCSTATTGGNVVWGMVYSIADVGGSFPTATTDSATVAASTVHSLAGLTEIDMAAYTGPSTMILIQLYRDSTSAADTHTTAAHLLEFDIHYVVNSLGSSGSISEGP